MISFFFFESVPKGRPKEQEVKMRKRPPRPWFAVRMDFFDYKGDHVMAVVDYLTSYIVTHTFRSTPSAKQLAIQRCTLPLF